MMMSKPNADLPANSFEIVFKPQRRIVRPLRVTSRTVNVSICGRCVFTPSPPTFKGYSGVAFCGRHVTLGRVCGWFEEECEVGGDDKRSVFTLRRRAGAAREQTRGVGGGE